MSERPGPEAEAFSLNFRLVIVKIGAVSGVLQIGVVQYCRVELCRVEYCRVQRHCTMGITCWNEGGAHIKCHIV